MSRFRFFVAGCGLLAAAVPLLAQTAQVTGRIADSSGGAIPGASIQVTNQRTEISRTSVTNSDGYYAIQLLPPSSYTVRVQSKGMKTSTREILLTVDQVARLDFVLEVGDLAESVTVSSDAAMLDTESATVGKVVENRRISDLPLNGRNALALMMLTPGVRSVAGPTQSGFSDRGTNLSNTSINGGPSGLNAFMLDGNTNNNLSGNELGVNPSVDAVQEFKIQTNTMSSEYGFTAGGVVNIVTKSGANKLHGTAYEFVRNDIFDARNAFAATRAPFRYNQFGGAIGGPVVIPKVYDGRNRSFFFFNYEEWRYRNSRNEIMTVPTAGQREGVFTDLRDATGKLVTIFDPATTRANPSGSGFVRDLFSGNVIPTSRLDPSSVKTLVVLPLPNRTPTNAFTNQQNLLSVIKNTLAMKQYTTRADHQFNNRNSMFVRLSWFQHLSDSGVFGGAYPEPATRQRIDDFQPKNFLLSDTHVFSPRVINEFRGGISRLYFTFTPASYGQNWPEKMGLPASVPRDVLPALNIAGLAGIGQTNMGIRGTYEWQFFDAVTMVLGKHTLKTGVDIRIRQANNLLRAVPSGSFTFPSGLTGNPQQQAGTGSGFATFMVGAVGSANIATYLGYSMEGRTGSAFLQDDWKITPRLTLNLGLRYQYQSPPAERHDGQSNFNPNARNPQNGLMGRMEYAGLDYGRTPWQSDKNNLGPRIGFAYDLLGHQRTILRGGYGMFMPTNFYVEFYGSNAGFSTTPTTYDPPGGNTNLPAFQFKDGLPFPATQPLGAKLGPSYLLSNPVSYTQTSNKYPASQQWNLSLQQQLGRGWLVDMAYSGNHMTHVIGGNWDLNQLDDKHYSLGLALQNQVPNPYAGLVPGTLGAATIQQSQALKPLPYYTSVNVTFPNLGNGIYHALLVSVEKRMSGGLAFLASYTKAKLISDSVENPVNFGAVEQTGVVGYQNGKFNRRAERSIDPTDVAQRLVLSAVYELPMGKGKRWSSSNRAVNSLIGGWQVNLIATMQGGIPVVVRGASNFRADRPNSTGVSAKLDNATAARWLNPDAFVNPPNFTLGNVGRTLPDVRSPSLTNFDLSLIKDTVLREGLRLQFRAESFNVVNHVNLRFPNATFSPGPDGKNVSGVFGVIASSRDARIGQLGLKLIF
jgi:hypothetical protein